MKRNYIVPITLVQHQHKRSSPHIGKLLEYIIYETVLDILSVRKQTFGKLYQQYKQ